MKFIDVPKPGDPDALVIAECPVPLPGPGEVLIKVAAAGLNRADILQRQGHYPPPPGAPKHPGLEVSGLVERLGPGASEFREGDRVCALLQGGGYAQYVCAAEGQVLPLPAGVDLVQGAALPEACFTVWSNVFMFGRLTAGETLLVHGGTSGIGVTAIQLAKARGARVLATAGSEAKCRMCESLGATAINYRTQDFAAAVRELTRGGANVILDMIAGDYTARNIDALAEEGRLVVIATQGGVSSTINMLKIMQKRAVLTGSTLRPRPVVFKAEVKRQLLRHVWPAIADGSYRIVIDRAFPLPEAAAAHRRMESSEHIGKILLTVDR
ncbi:MAG: NAD(P)H-quinone oxidoreductase [Proteobacteria bacterium]|nr:NAD(P)H-quinone oxidoreductase [Pseudomonadota bacterium]